MSSKQLSFADFRGKSEGLTLEFKASAALGDPLTLPRAVCSFLNSGGGHILVGMGDDGQTLDPVANPAVAKRQLEDLLASTIAPSLPHQVSVEVSPDAPALVIVVPKSAGNGQLFAVRSTQGRFLVPTRVGARTLPLEWSDIAARIQKGKHDLTPRQQQSDLQQAIDRWLGKADVDSPRLLESGAIYLILRAVPGDAESVVEPWENLRAELSRALIDPSIAGCQRGQAGFWDLRGDVEKSSTPSKGGATEVIYRSGSRSEGFRILEIQESPVRELRFATRLDGAFVWGQTFDAKRTSKLLSPYGVSQTVVSCCRLFAHLLERGGESPAQVLSALDLRRLAGLRLPPGAPAPGWGYSEAPGWPRVLGDPGPVVPAAFDGDFISQPDLIARRLLELLYMRSGWNAMDVPFFDSRSKRFVYT
ncbi:MAG: ATP-binding protein [Planctomycetota bacterium]|nr:ATP-binding protein [Planctomycetota bacterium]